MTPHEAKALEVKLDMFRRLSARSEQLRAIIDQLTLNRDSDPNKTGPFTGNTRETRKITRLRIDFSKTLGGSPEVDMTIDSLNIPARDFQRFMLSLLHTEAGVIQSEMEKL